MPYPPTRASTLATFELVSTFAKRDLRVGRSSRSRLSRGFAARHRAEARCCLDDVRALGTAEGGAPGVGVMTGGVAGAGARSDAWTFAVKPGDAGSAPPAFSREYPDCRLRAKATMRQSKRRSERCACVPASGRHSPFRLRSSAAFKNAALALFMQDLDQHGRPAMSCRLPTQAFEMIVHGRRRYAEHLGDFVTALATNHEREHFNFTFGRPVSLGGLSSSSVSICALRISRSRGRPPRRATQGAAVTIPPA